MAFPDTPLNPLLELLVDGAWLPVPTYERDIVDIEAGLRERGAVTDPGNLSITINNRDGRFSPRNPLSPYYGKIGRNTRCRLSVPGTESFLELENLGTAGYASTPDAAPLDITGALDIRWEGEANWYAPGSQMLIGKWDAAGQRSYHLRLQDGNVVLHVASDGIVGAFAGGVLPALPRRAAVRGTVTIGADWTFRLYWAESLDGPWTQAGGDVVVPGAAPIFASTSALRISPPEQPETTPPRRAVQGRCYRAQVRSGIDGPIVAAPDFRGLAGGTTSFTDSAGRTWTVAGTASVRDRADLFVGEVSEWPQEWTPDGADAWVPIQGSGILRRLGQGRKALQSTLRRRIPSGRPLAYWPMEDGASAVQAASALDGGQQLFVTGLSFASDTSLPSSDALPTLGDSATLHGNVPGATAGGWHVEMVYKLDKLPETEQTMLSVWLSGSTGGVRQVRARVSTASIKVEALDAEGAVIAFFTHTGTGRGDFIAAWNRLQLFSFYTGTQTYVALAWREVVTGLWWVVYTPYTGTPGRITTVRGSWGSDFQGMTLGHLAAFDVGGVSASVPGVQIYEGSDDGFTGETAWTRMRRLASEENLQLARLPGLEATERVGPQTIDTLLDLLQAAADADGGMLLEDRRRPGLLFRERSSLYNQKPALVLSYDQKPGLKAPLKPVDDDTAVRNDRTVKRQDGSEARAVLEEGPLSVQPPPAGIGLYDDSVTLSLHSDAQTGPIAHWRLHLGTHDGVRYPKVRVMLHKAPELIPAVLRLTEGDLIRITDLPQWVGYGHVDLLVDGIRHAARLTQWEVEFTCSPAQPWQVGVLEDALYGRVDTDGSTLVTAAGAADTALTVLTPAGPAWVTAQPSLTANPDFGTDLTGWAGNGAAIERVAAPQPAPFAGERAMKVTPDGAAAFPNAGASAVPVTPGQSYVASGWLRSATSRSIDLNANWFDGTGAYLATSPNGKAVTAGTWTWFELTATAPVGAAFGNISPTIPTTPPPTDVVWAHGVTLRPAGGMPQEFPFDVSAGGETMTVTAITDSRTDTFGRTVAGGWGQADSGQAWTVVGAAADYSVGAGYAVAAQPTTGVAHLTLLPAPGPDVDLYLDVASSALATGASLFTGPLVRAVDNNNHYQARIEFTTAGAVLLTLRERVGAVETVLGSHTSDLTHTAGTWYRVRLKTIGSSLRAKVWLASATEPAAWQITVTDTSLTAAGSVGTRSYRNTGNTSAGVEMRFDNLRVINPQIFTVRRAVNGIAKDHTAGTDVRLANPTIVAL
ncbi:hypothetical protein ACIRPR_33535 [Streptomyces griseoflavus]|uniref:hypothetical protein n=1 Tax=Streptomyces griseoflavus TaxID=35619 RepID=UPI0037F477EF